MPVPRERRAAYLYISNRECVPRVVNVHVFKSISVPVPRELCAAYVYISNCKCVFRVVNVNVCISISVREVGGWGRDPFSRNFMKPTPRRKWYLTTGRRFH